MDGGPVSRQVALLRGVTVARARPVAMDALRRIVQGLGADGVATHLRGDNVVCSTAERPSRMAARLSAALADETARNWRTVVRLAEMAPA